MIAESAFPALTLRPIHPMSNDVEVEGAFSLGQPFVWLSDAEESMKGVHMHIVQDGLNVSLASDNVQEMDAFWYIQM